MAAQISSPSELPGSQPTTPKPKPDALKPKYDELASSLDFEEFSFIGADESLEMINVSNENRQLLKEYLRRYLGVCRVDYRLPFVVLSCEELDAPSDAQRPMVIAGLIAIWRTLGHPGHLGIPDEQAWGPSVRIDRELLDLVKVGECIPQQVTLYLADHVFPTSNAITLLWDTLIIELPDMSEDEFVTALGTLPAGIEGLPYSLAYRNGSLI
ncbi:hypothetical protein AK830_g5796 [Neonectria ditissima]|uniref:Uncharacterized protein n=1 Tax=Neonectria ditissima TaxID=78410 RepID=A0A0P7B425_9HYPO|nr:hypothetical protein AK830_g5796 [Neonectria ditissima]